MSEPFTCGVCGVLRSTNARFCKNCGRPFVAMPVQPSPPAAPAPTRTKAAARTVLATTRRPARQKDLLLAVWAVATAALLWLSLQPPAPDGIADGEIIAAAATPAPAPAPPKPPDVDEVYRCVVRALDGRVLGKFDILLVTKQHVREVGSTRLVRGVGDIRHTVRPFSPVLLARIEAAAEVIVIVTADLTPVNVPDNPKENRRADDRASTLFEVVKRIRRGREQSVFKANFGQWSAAAGGVNYNDQRRIIIVEVRERDASLPMHVGLRQALEQHQNAQRIFHHLLNNYSRSGDFEVL